MNHFRREVARAAARQRERADNARESQAAKIHAGVVAIGGQLPVMVGEITSQLLAVKFVAAVHRRGRRPLVLFYLSGSLLGGEVGKAVDGDRAGEQEFHRLSTPTRLLESQFEQTERSLHVHLVRGFGGELGTGGEKGGQVIDLPHFVLADDALHEVAVENGPRERRPAFGGQGAVHGFQIHGNNVVVALSSQLENETVAYFAVGTGDEKNRFTHAKLLPPAFYSEPCFPVRPSM